MDDRVKERLTGAAILVALVVLLVPEIFAGRDSPAAAPATPALGNEGAPLRSYTIQLDAADGRATGNAAPTVSVQPAGNTLPTVAPTDRIPEPISQVATPASGPATPAAEPLPPVAANAVPAGNAGGWVVQLGSFSRRENAEKMVQSAAGKGIKLAIAGPDARGLYRVRTSPLAQRQAAANLQAQLRSQGYDGVINASQ